MEIEIKEVTSLPGRKLPSVEAFGRSRKREPGSLYEVQLKEPINHTVGKSKSESATTSGFVNLQENRIMNTQTHNPQLNRDRMTEAFKRLGLSDEGSKIAATGRDPEIGVGDSIPASMRESMNRIGGVGDIQPGSVVIHHPAGRIQGMGGSSSIPEYKPEEDQAKMIEAFKRLGMSDQAARSAARGRGGY